MYVCAVFLSAVSTSIFELAWVHVIAVYGVVAPESENAAEAVITHVTGSVVHGLVKV